MDTIVCSRDTLGIPWDLWPLKKLKTPNGIAASPSQLVGPFGPCSWMVSQWLAPAVCWSRAPVSLLACMQNNLAFWGCLIFWVIPVTTQQLLNGNAFSTLMAPQRNIWLSMKKTYSPFGGRPDPPPTNRRIHLYPLDFYDLGCFGNIDQCSPLQIQMAHFNSRDGCPILIHFFFYLIFMIWSSWSKIS